MYMYMYMHVLHQPVLVVAVFSTGLRRVIGIAISTIGTLGTSALRV